MSTAGTPLVLVVDDDPTACLMLEGILQDVGFRTLKAESAAQALQTARDRIPDLILLDITLPDGNGYDICRHLRETSATASVPVIFISADDDVSAKVTAFEAGGVDYVTKPVAGEEVIARVRTHLRLKQAYESLARLQAERLQRLTRAQQTIYPAPDEIPEARFAVSLLQTLGAGGDFYDVIAFGNTLADYIVADSCGHDIDATFWTAALKALLHEYASPVDPPGTILFSINNAIQRILPAGAFFTLLYVRLNRGSHHLSLASAGHPPAIIIPPDAPPHTLPVRGDLLGVFPDPQFGLQEARFPAASRLLLYTDGLAESQGTLQDGIQVILDAAAQHRQLPLGEMIDAITGQLLHDHTPTDDVLLLGVET